MKNSFSYPKQIFAKLFSKQVTINKIISHQLAQHWLFSLYQNLDLDKNLGWIFFSWRQLIILKVPSNNKGALPGIDLSPDIGLPFTNLVNHLHSSWQQGLNRPVDCLASIPFIEAKVVFDLRPMPQDEFYDVELIFFFHKNIFNVVLLTIVYEVYSKEVSALRNP